VKDVKRDLNQSIKSVRGDSEHRISRETVKILYLVAELTYTPRASNCLGGIVRGIARRHPREVGDGKLVMKKRGSGFSLVLCHSFVRGTHTPRYAHNAMLRAKGFLLL
jgi:hypothetical protein